MLETNIRLFKGGTQLSLQVRRVKIDSWQEGTINQLGALEATKLALAEFINL